MNYADRLAKAKAKYAALRPPAPTPIPTVERIYHILNCKLSPNRQNYFAPIHCPQDAPHNLRTPTHFVHIKECGRPLQMCRHLITFFLCSPTHKTVQDILDTPPICSLYSRPFIFHDTNAAISEIKHQIQTQL
jgi:hypothetical protein